MKKMLYAVIAALVVLMLVVTCPSKEQHKEVIMSRVSAVVDKKMQEAVKDNSNSWSMGIATLGSMFASKVLESALDAKLEVSNYVLCSVGRLEYEGEREMVSLGLLNQIITFKEEDLEEYLEK